MAISDGNSGGVVAIDSLGPNKAPDATSRPGPLFSYVYRILTRGQHNSIFSL